MARPRNMARRWGAAVGLAAEILAFGYLVDPGLGNDENPVGRWIQDLSTRPLTGEVGHHPALEFVIGFAGTLTGELFQRGMQHMPRGLAGVGGGIALVTCVTLHGDGEAAVDRLVREGGLAGQAGAQHRQSNRSSHHRIALVLGIVRVHERYYSENVNTNTNDF